MADVRSLLRDERSVRRLSHPFAFYSASGVLMCRICRTTVKSEVLWDTHVRTKQHINQVQLESERNITKPAGPGVTRKRKAGHDDGHERKKSKGGLRDVVDGTSLGNIEEQLVEDTHNTPEELGSPAAPIVKSSNASEAVSPVDEDEWAAFERGVATPPPEEVSTTAHRAGATIEAAPLSAAQLAKQENGANSAQRVDQDLYIEEEKDDASKQLEDELDQMNELEQRVNRLKDRREALRRGVEHAAKANTVEPTVTTHPLSISQDEGEDSAEDEWDPWR